MIRGLVEALGKRWFTMQQNFYAPKLRH